MKLLEIEDNKHYIERTISKIRGTPQKKQIRQSIIEYLPLKIIKLRAE